MADSGPAFYLKIEGVQGESTIDGLSGFMDLLSFNWGGSHTGAMATSTSGTGRFTAQDFSFTMTTNTASPVLMEACANGKQFASAILICRKASGTPVDYLKVTLSPVMISNFTTGFTPPSANNPNTNPIVTDQIQLNFGKIVAQYTPIQPGGSPGAAVEGGFNLMTGKNS